jgi:hypothetical protein
MRKVRDFASGKENCAFWFFPFFEIPLNDLPNFCDISIQHNNQPKYVLKLHLWLSKTGYGDKQYYEQVDRITKYPNYIIEYIPEPGYRAFVFDVPEKWKYDYETILSGRTDKLSDEYRAANKQYIPEGYLKFVERQNRLTDHHTTDRYQGKVL